MKIHTTNSFNTFIESAEDSAATKGTIPESKRNQKTIASFEYEIIHQHPYQYTSDDVLFKVYAERNNIATENLSGEREKFFSKGRACFRASPLTKRYGWGVHSNQDGKLALYGIETKEYKKFVNDGSVQQLKAMRNRKK